MFLGSTSHCNSLKQLFMLCMECEEDYRGATLFLRFFGGCIRAFRIRAIDQWIGLMGWKRFRRETHSLKDDAFQLVNSCMER